MSPRPPRRFLAAPLATGFVFFALLAAFAASPAFAAAFLDDAVEVRGDFHYDAQGVPIAVRHAEWPAGVERGPMSHAEKFELLGIELPERPAQLEPRHVRPKPASVTASDKWHNERVMVKFAEGTPVRLRGGSLTAPGAYLAPVRAVLAAYPEAEIGRAFSLPEAVLDSDKETGERIGGRELADLNNWYLVRFPEGSLRGVDLANELLALDEIETAYPLPKAEPAACEDIAPVTPDFEGNQFYLGPAPAGVDAYFAWSHHAGGDGAGAGYHVIDCEWGWCTGHEDLDITTADVINGLSGGSDPNHGTAVLGEIGACDNEYGVTGISHDVQLKMSDFDSEPTWAANIATAGAAALAGEVVLLEIHIPGPDTGQNCQCNCSQFEFVPVEWEQASYDAIATATANGVVVVEAGGNGSMDLDRADYQGLFDLMVRDSGAIIVGAGMPGSHSPECWTNHGRRIDVHGYGSQVATTGYGTLQNMSGCAQDYSNSFSGTSSASPIIVGVCASVQGVANEKHGFDILPHKLREIIKVDGTPQGPPTFKIIRNLPNLAAVLPALDDAVAAPDVAALPSGLLLAAPEPNPANGETRIRFDVPAGGAEVSITVHDVAGRRVAELAAGSMPAGRHTLRWDGRDAAGAPVAAGLYFVRMESERGVATRKLTLLR
jgi:hypothetical protein